MSTLRVNEITNEAGTGAVEFSQGLRVAANKTITSNINLTGICTAASFVGSGSGITVTGGVTLPKIFATILIT